MEGQHAQTLFEAAIFPALSGFVLCLAFVLIAAWRPAGRPGPWGPLTPGRRRRLLRTTGLLAALGTLGFGAIVLGYSVILQHEPGATSAVWGGAFLLAVAAVVWGGSRWPSTAPRAREGEPGPRSPIRRRTGPARGLDSRPATILMPLHELDRRTGARSPVGTNDDRTRRPSSDALR